MTASAPRPVGAVLLSAMPQLTERLAEHRLRREWPALVGRETARRARPGGLSAGVLTVVVDNSPWLHELTLRSTELTARLAQHVPGLRALRFTLGRLEETDDAPPTFRPSPHSLSAADRADIDAAAAAIADPTVAAAARRLLTTARRFPVVPREGR